jgi:hypothetical protein
MHHQRGAQIAINIYVHVCVCVCVRAHIHARTQVIKNTTRYVQYLFRGTALATYNGKKFGDGSKAEIIVNIQNEMS